MNTHYTQEHNIPDNWECVTLGELFRVKHGLAFKGQYFTDQPQAHILLTPGNFCPGGGFQHSKPKYYNGPVPPEYVLLPQDIVVTMTDLSKNADTLGYAIAIPNGGCGWLHNQRVGRLVFHNNKILPQFVPYLLRGHGYRTWIIGSASGSTVRHTSPERIESARVLLPPLSEQHAIVHMLHTLDTRIAVCRAQIATLEATAQALFADWFVDFGPVRAKMAGHFLASESRDVVDLFPAKLDAQGKPEGWTWGTIADCATVRNTGRAPLSAQERARRKGRFPYYGAVSVLDYLNDYTFDGTYVLLAEDGTVMNVDRSPATQYVWGKFRVSNHAHVVAGKNGYSAEFLCVFFRQVNILPFVTGAVQAKLTQKNVLSVPILQSPSGAVERAFCQRIAPIFAKIRSNTVQMATLSTFRDAQLPKLLCGELRVSGTA